MLKQHIHTFRLAIFVLFIFLSKKTISFEHIGYFLKFHWPPQYVPYILEDDRFYVSNSAHFAYGIIKQGIKKVYKWPFTPLSVAHTINSYQKYSGTAYFHHGIDIRILAGTSVFASSGGKVINIENYVKDNPAYWEVAILDDDGLLWQYHHIERSSIPEEIFYAWKNGIPIEEGTKIGEIYQWQVESFGERFDHLHLNVLGKNRTYLNPLLFLEPINDIQEPKILEVGILKNGKKWPKNSVNGSYSIYAKIHDLIMHQHYVVPPYYISYSLDGMMEKVVWVFDTLPGGNSTTKYVNDFFVPSMTCGDYVCRELVIDLGFSVPQNSQFPTTPGKHNIKLITKDIYGNKSESSFEWFVE